MNQKDQNLSEEELSKFFNILKHPIRRQIIRILHENAHSYTDILNKLDISESSVLNYHLREMRDLIIDKDKNSKYGLNDVGNICYQLVIRIKEKQHDYDPEKFDIIVNAFRRSIKMIQSIFSILILGLIVEMAIFNLIDPYSLIGPLASGIIFSIIMVTSVTLVGNSSESRSYIIKKDEKLNLFITLLAIWLIIQIIFEIAF